ncbi:MAG: PaaI family thioesterase [Hyphomicrobiaceae bacterium]|nr:PaaI family thioesterase [Hyphomicrobiaceae bacterium]
MTELIEKLRRNTPPFMRLLGVELVSATLDRVEARLTVREDMENGSGITHGGVYMSFADYLGAIGTVANLPKGASTTTMESKTNFFRPAPIGSVITGVSTPLHKGRRTMVWQTRLADKDDKLLAMITQTQMVIVKEG